MGVGEQKQERVESLKKVEVISKGRLGTARVRAWSFPLTAIALVIRFSTSLVLHNYVERKSTVGVHRSEGI